MEFYGVVSFLVLFLCHMVACQKKVRFCVWSDRAMTKCQNMTDAFELQNLRQVICMQEKSKYACMSKVEAGKADILKIDASNLYAAEKVYGLIPILKEAKTTLPNDEGYLYKAVVIIRSNMTVTSLDDLYRKKSCHTGVGRTVGWTVPVSNLQAMGVMDVLDCDNTVYNVANFFSKSCAPGAYVAKNDVNGDNPANVCELCKSNRCPATDDYAGYRGAVQCLMKGVGDVAFAKHSTINDLISSGVEINKEIFRLLCPDGTKKHVDEWHNCYWATRPTDVIVTSPKKTEQSKSHIRSLFSRGSTLFNGEDGAVAAFRMFASDDYNSTNVLFTDGMKQLLGVTSSKSSPYLDGGYMNTMLHFTPCNVSERWCVVSDTEMDKCKQMSAAFAAARITNRMSCVRAQSHKHCMEKIESGDADLMTADGGDVYTAGKYHDLVPIMAESYGQSGSTSYWAVAVVKKSNAGFNMKTLKGKKSCHTGIRKTSGWNVPIGTLIEMGSISGADTQCDIVKNVGKFFTESCVPGALDPKYDPTGGNPANLCKLCGGKGACKRDDSNKYYGYRGAFRCLVETGADVAFVKHSTVVDNTDGGLKEDWARNLKSSDFELLCPDGSRAPITSWQTCNLAQVPSHTVITRSDKSKKDRRHYATILKKGQLHYESDTEFNMFDNDLFDDSTTSLTDILEDRQDFRKWLGTAYVKAIEALDKKPCVSAGTTTVISLYMLTLSLLIALSAVHR